MKVLCPGCSNALSRIMVGDIVLDVCQGGCAGIWFDYKEINRIKDFQGETDILFHLKKNPDLKLNLNISRLCPYCNNVELERQTYNEIEIDVCPACNGIWLDAGEIREFIKDSGSFSRVNREQKESYDKLKQAFSSEKRHDDNKINDVINFLSSKLRVEKEV